MGDNKDDKNVVNMAEARRRQRTDRIAGASKFPGQSKTSSSLGKKLWGYVQVVLFLGLILYFMQICRGPQL